MTRVIEELRPHAPHHTIGHRQRLELTLPEIVAETFCWSAVMIPFFTAHDRAVAPREPTPPSPRRVTASTTHILPTLPALGTTICAESFAAYRDWWISGSDLWQPLDPSSFSLDYAAQTVHCWLRQGDLPALPRLQRFALYHRDTIASLFDAGMPGSIVARELGVSWTAETARYALRSALRRLGPVLFDTEYPAELQIYSQLPPEPEVSKTAALGIGLPPEDQSRLASLLPEIRRRWLHDETPQRIVDDLRIPHLRTRITFLAARGSFGFDSIRKCRSAGILPDVLEHLRRHGSVEEACEGFEVRASVLRKLLKFESTTVGKCTRYLPELRLLWRMGIPGKKMAAIIGVPYLRMIEFVCEMRRDRGLFPLRLDRPDKPEDLFTPKQLHQLANPNIPFAQICREHGIRDPEILYLKVSQARRRWGEDTVPRRSPHWNPIEKRPEAATFRLIIAAGLGLAGAKKLLGWHRLSCQRYATLWKKEIAQVSNKELARAIIDRQVPHGIFCSLRKATAVRVAGHRQGFVLTIRCKNGRFFVTRSSARIRHFPLRRR